MHSMVAAGTELPVDSHGFTNLLLLGAGGTHHDAGDLTDTNIIASIDQQTKTVSMLSVPRDLWVNPDRYEPSRINEVIRNVYGTLTKKYDMPEEEALKEAIRVLIEELEQFTGVEIHQHALIDFQGFVQMVDAIEGIDVMVKQTIIDEAYPDGNWGYETFMITKGMQHLDGETALKFARSRHTTSDFSRSKRQQDVIEAIREKTLDLGVLTSSRKIRKLMKIMSDNFKTDLSFGQMITLGGIASSLEKQNIFSHVFTNNWEEEGGFLGNPPRSEYGGASVLIPITPSLEEIHHYVSNVLFRRNLLLNPPRIEVLNGTKIKGRANKMKHFLVRYGIPVVAVGNAKNKEIQEKTQIILYQKTEEETPFSRPAGTDIIESLLQVPATIQPDDYIENDVDITIIVGKDFRKRF